MGARPYDVTFAKNFDFLIRFRHRRLQTGGGWRISRRNAHGNAPDHMRVANFQYPIRCTMVSQLQTSLAFLVSHVCLSPSGTPTKRYCGNCGQQFYRAYGKFMKLHKSKFVMYMQVMDKCLPRLSLQLVPKKKYVRPMEQQKASEITKEKT